MLKEKDGLEDNRTITKIVMTSSRVRDKNNVTYTDGEASYLKIFGGFPRFLYTVDII